MTEVDFWISSTHGWRHHRHRRSKDALFFCQSLLSRNCTCTHTSLIHPFGMRWKCLSSIYCKQFKKFFL